MALALNNLQRLICHWRNQTKLNQTKPNQAKPNQAKPNQTKPNQTKPNQAKPNQTTKPLSKWVDYTEHLHLLCYKVR